MDIEVQHANDALIVGIVITLVLIGVISTFYKFYIMQFKSRARYLKMEMKRSYGREYQYWNRKLKRHYVRSIPLIGKFLVRFIK